MRCLQSSTGMFLSVLFVVLPAAAAEVRGTWFCPSSGTHQAVIYLEPVRLPAGVQLPKRQDLQVMKQQGLRFDPHILVVQVGTEVAFPNFDPVYHNVFSPSPTKLFNLGVYPPGESRSVVLDRPGMVEILCHLHPHMYGIIVVLATPYFTQTDDKGAFALRDIEPGVYRLKYWSEHCGEGLIRTVDLTQEKEVVVRWPTLPPPRRR